MQTGRANLLGAGDFSSTIIAARKRSFLLKKSCKGKLLGAKCSFAFHFMHLIEPFLYGEESLGFFLRLIVFGGIVRAFCT